MGVKSSRPAAAVIPAFDQMPERLKDGPAESIDPTTVYCSSWSSLSKEEVVDKVKGTIYGQAIGDAIGLATEFLNKETSMKTYGPTGPSGYHDIISDRHRDKWGKGDWTDDTDQLLLILTSLVQKGGRVDRLDFARRLHNWMYYGFEELGDICGRGIGDTVGRTLEHKEFMNDPHRAAREVWEQWGCTSAANGAVMRTSILGLIQFHDLDKVMKNTLEISAVTHADPRCAASCVAMTTAVALMLQGRYDANKPDHLVQLVEECLQYSDKVLAGEEGQRAELRKHIGVEDLSELMLDGAGMGYTFKALGAGFYGLRKATDFRQTIMKLIMEGGDADTNGAVCGALMGCKFGFKALPQDLLQFKHRQWLDDRVDSLLRLMGLIG